MRIGFDVSQTGEKKAGCGYFAQSLIQTLSTIDTLNQYILYPSFGDFFYDRRISRTVRIRQNNFSCGVTQHSRFSLENFWRDLTLEKEVILGEPDLIHSNNYFCPMGLQKAKLVYTLYDLSFLRYPEWTTEKNRQGCFEGVLKASLFADHIIAISHHTRNEFLQNFPYFPSEKITVVYPASRFSAATIARTRKDWSFVSEGFWLTVGTIEPRKNYSYLLKAYAKWKALQTSPLPLVVVGGDGWMMEEISACLAELSLSEQDVCFLGYLPDEEMKWLYENCYAFVYPSHYEGFGLPVLEAMSLGAAVIVSNRGALPELVAGAGMVIDITDEKHLVDALQKLSSDLSARKHLRQDALERSKCFSWRTSAEKLLDIYNRVVI